MRTSPIIVALLFAAACGGASSDAGHPTAPPTGSASAPPSAPSAAPATTASATAAPVDAAAFVAAAAAEIRPLEIAANRAWFEASVTGTDEAFAKSREAENTRLRYYADPTRFAQVKALRADGRVTDPLIKRQLDVLYLAMLGKQVEPKLLEEITAIGSEIEQAFNTYRGQVDGKELTQNEVNEILRSATDSKKLQTAWEAQKGVGALVAPRLRRLVALRNDVARRLGFRDYYALRIEENELDEPKLLALADELDRLTRDAFLGHKAEVDRRLSKKLRVPTAELMPWHYQNPFFQEPPAVFDTGLDALYEKQDVLALCRKFYGGMGLEIEQLLAQSDLYEKKGKSPHAFSSDVDREGDIRILANVVPGLEWQSTMLHELGHATYSKYLGRDLPWLLRIEPHPLTTEGVAMMLERMAGDPRWAAAMGVMTPAARDRALPEAQRYLAFSSLQFSRWALVMLHFERELYRDPSQDLNRLWWDLVERYQGLKRPAGRSAPDYASKIHLVVAPVYYQNYMLGELFSAQLHEALAKELGRPPADTIYVGEAKVGELLRTRVFLQGSRYRWAELVERATGRPLGPEAFARRFDPKKG